MVNFKGLYCIILCKFEEKDTYFLALSASELLHKFKLQLREGCIMGNLSFKLIRSFFGERDFILSFKYG